MTQTVPDISPLMPMHQDPLLVHTVNQIKSLFPEHMVWFHECRWSKINPLKPSDVYMRRKLPIVGSNNGLSPVHHQAIIRTNDDILSIRPLRIHFKEMLFEF